MKKSELFTLTGHIFLAAVCVINQYATLALIVAGAWIIAGITMSFKEDKDDTDTQP